MAIEEEDVTWDETAQKLLGMTDEETNIFQHIGDDAEEIATHLRQMADA
jgi:hypothetical protein